jgi:GMP synthase (glutamine-hydrolysing)
MLKVVQNDPEVPPGLLLELLHEQDLPYRLVPIYAEDRSWDLTTGDGVIVLGGVMSVRDTVQFPFLPQLKGQIGELVRRGVPYLGICLGGQLLAEVLGGRVHLQKCGERGCHEISLTEQGERDPLFAGMPRQFNSFQWHGDSFDLPPDALHLARTDVCPYQAFRWGRAAYGLQFHPEVTQRVVSDWSSVMGLDQTMVVKAFKAVEKDYRLASLRLLRNFLNMTD